MSASAQEPSGQPGIDPTAAPGLSTVVARGGWAPDFVTRTSNPPIYQTTAFDLESLEELDAVAAGKTAGYIYTRDGNPNQDAFAADVAAMEQAEAGIACASGMGALTATLFGMLKSGDHVVAAEGLYGRTIQLLRHWQSACGVSIDFVSALEPAEFANAIQPNTRLVIVESVANPLLDVADLPAIAQACGEVPLLVDSTFATPALIRPVEHGASLVWHSASKYLNGHGDVMLGVTVGTQAMIRRVRAQTSLCGLNANPFECWLASRGLRTLPLRMARVSETAAQLADWLTGQPQVGRVNYPGLASHRTASVARRLLTRGFGGMLSFEITGGRPAVDALFRALAPEIPFSPTLADARTTVSYPAGTSHKFVSAEERSRLGISEGLVRLSVGLEDVADLQRSLVRGLAAL